MAIRGVEASGQASWDRMMAGFTQTAANQPRGNRIGSFAARYNATRSSNRGLIGQISAQQSSAKQANITRRKQIEEMYDRMMEMVGPGGAFEKRGLGEIESARTKGVGKQTQQMISSGMYGTTTAAGIGKQWEADVGAPARLRLEDIMQQRQLGVMGQKAGFLERIEDVYPDYSSLLQMLAR